MAGMKVELSEKAADAVKARLESGDYRSPEEVVEAAIRLLEERDEAYWAHVERKIAEAREDFAAGRYRRIDDLDAYIAELRADVIRRGAAGSSAHR